jgi:hypothetical protein
VYLGVNKEAQVSITKQMKLEFSKDTPTNTSCHFILVFR